MPSSTAPRFFIVKPVRKPHQPFSCCTASPRRRRLETDGETGAALLVKQLGTICETARDLAYRLFKISERRKWIEDAVSYNSLAASWTEIIRLAAERDTTAAQAKLGY